jgi:hypothetical protein
MARFDDGELYVELEVATIEEAQRALVAARRMIADAGVSLVDVMRATARREALFEKEILWEDGRGPEPEWLTDHENHCADIAEEAGMAAEAAAGDKRCKLGLLDLPPEQAPAVRDLFECVL